MLHFIEEKQSSIQTMLQRSELSSDAAWVEVLKTMLKVMIACLAKLAELRHYTEELPELSDTCWGWVDFQKQISVVSNHDGKGILNPGKRVASKNSDVLHAMRVAKNVSVGSWDFDALKVARDHDGYMFQIAGSDFLLSFQTLSKGCTAEFLQELESKYKKENPYHSNAHAADMANSFSCMLNACSEMKEVLSQARQICIFVAALGHDVGHPGSNNLFHINMSHDLALTYNDCSVLENFHAAELMRILARPFGKSSKKLLAGLNAVQFQHERKMMIKLILSTDMSKHVADLADFRLALDNPKFDPVETATDQDMALMWLFRASDISHSAKPWEVHREWSHRITQEFHAQGDEEKRLGLPVSPLCDRDDFNMAKAQCGFLQFVCIPVFVQLARLQELIMKSIPKHSVSLTKFQMESELPQAVPVSRSEPVSQRTKARAFPFDLLTGIKVYPDEEAMEITYDSLSSVCLHLCKGNLLLWQNMKDN